SPESLPRPDDHRVPAAARRPRDGPRARRLRPRTVAPDRRDARGGTAQRAVGRAGRRSSLALVRHLLPRTEHRRRPTHAPIHHPRLTSHTIRSFAMRRHLLAPALAFALAAALTVPAHANCGAEGCPFAPLGPEAPNGMFSFDIGYQSIDQDGQ